MRILLPFVLIPVALAACGDDGTTPSDPEALIGTWRELPSTASPRPPTPVGERSTLRFRADGTMTLGSFDEALPGEATYGVDGDDLTIMTPFGAATVPFRVTADDRLAFQAMTPSGAVDGVVGTWTAEVRSDDMARTVTIVLRGDGTATLTNYMTSSPEPFTVMWLGNGADVAIVGNGNFPIAQLSLMDGVLAEAYERVP